MVDCLISERDGAPMATIMARNGVSDEAILDAINAKLIGSIAQSACIAAIHVAPGVWLALLGSTSIEELSERTRDLASIFDQTGAYIVFQLSGSDAVPVLQSGVYIDLDPRAFPIGSAAVSVIAHIDVTIWRREQTVFEIAVFRSYADSFRHWLDVACERTSL